MSAEEIRKLRLVLDPKGVPLRIVQEGDPGEV